MLNRPVENQNINNEKQLELKSEISSDEYVDGVNRIKQYIVEGDIIQAVYSQPFTCNAPPDPVMIYKSRT